MRSTEVRRKVAEFRNRTAHGDVDDDCFVPWYLQSEFHLSDSVCFQRSSSGTQGKRRNYDFGLDGYHLDYESEPKLVLIQAKFSDSVGYIAKGFGDFLRLMNFLTNALKERDIDVPAENHVLVNLRADLKKVDSVDLRKIKLDFRVIHLSDLDKEVLLYRTTASREKFSNELRKRLPDHESQVDIIGPRDMGDRPEIIPRQAEYELNVRYLHSYDADNDAKMYFGIARLADFVRMYENRREDLFSKNIRYYITSTRNTRSGPAGRIKETLKDICIKEKDGTYRQSPRMFAALHNGISLFSSMVEPPETDYSSQSKIQSVAKIREPYVINGCQTIKSSYYFKGEKEDLVDSDRWEQIEVPLRIIETPDLEIVRTVTLSNNFQNAVSYSALHANDEDQITLQRRFEEAGIFYQRQNGAFDSLARDRPELFQDKYKNTNDTYIDIVELARAIMAAAGEVHYARSPSDIFEIKRAYEKCFHKDKLRSITLLVFLVNLYWIMPTVLKKNLGLEDLKWEKGSRKGPPPSRFANMSVCLFVRYLAKQQMAEFVDGFGHKLCEEDLRWKVRDLMRRSGLRKTLASWMKLEDKASELNEAFDDAKREHRLGDYTDPFERLA